MFFQKSTEANQKWTKCLQKTYKTKNTEDQSKNDRLAYQIEEDLDVSVNSKGGTHEVYFTVARKMKTSKRRKEVNGKSEGT